MKKITVTHFIKDKYDAIDFETSMKANDLLLALWDISQELFRPARKHGYADNSIQDIIDHADKHDMNYPNKDCDENYNIATEMVSALEKKFYDILEEHGVNIDKLIY